MKGFKRDWQDLIDKAAEYINNGDPLKDVVDDCEIAEMICDLSEALKEV